MSNWIKLAVAAAVLAVLGMAGIAALDFRPNDPRVRLRAHANYTHGPYLAYVSPWGAHNPIAGLWANRADNIRIDTAQFPQNSRISWRWPPLRPHGGLSIWGYDHIAYGDYDGGIPEQPVAPRRLAETKRFEQSFAWQGDFRYTAATLLTELYLRSDPQDADAKKLEIGWFLHAPSQTKVAADAGKQLGDYRDPQGRVWQVSLSDKFLTFLRRDGQDTPRGEIDMLHALRWLQAKGLVDGSDWITGVALGVEPMKGFGHVELASWHVRFE